MRPSKFHRLLRYPRALRAIAKVAGMRNIPTTEDALTDALLYHLMQHRAGRTLKKDKLSHLSYVAFCGAALLECDGKHEQLYSTEMADEDERAALEEDFQLLSDPEATLDLGDKDKPVPDAVDIDVVHTRAPRLLDDDECARLADLKVMRS